MGLSLLAMMYAADARAADVLMSALGIEEVTYEKLNLTVRAINQARKERGLPPLI